MCSLRPARWGCRKAYSGGLTGWLSRLEKDQISGGPALFPHQHPIPRALLRLPRTLPSPLRLFELHPSKLKFHPSQAPLLPIGCGMSFRTGDPSTSPCNSQARDSSRVLLLGQARGLLATQNGTMALGIPCALPAILKTLYLMAVSRAMAGQLLDGIFPRRPCPSQLLRSGQGEGRGVPNCH